MPHPSVLLSWGCTSLQLFSGTTPGWARACPSPCRDPAASSSFPGQSVMPPTTLVTPSQPQNHGSVALYASRAHTLGADVG